MITDKIIFWGLCATLIFLPLPFGLVEEWAIFIFEAATLVLFASYILGRHSSRKNNGKRKKPQRLKFPLLLKILLVIFLGITVIQLIPLPQFLLKILSPRTIDVYNGVYSGELNELGKVGWRTLSFSPDLSFYELIKYICYFLFGYLVLKCIKTKKEIEIFILVMLISAVFQSFYGLTELLGGTERIFSYKKKWSIGHASGTYINSNHFSGFLEMIFPVSVGYLLAKANFFSMKKGLSVKEKILWFSQEHLQKSILLGSISVLIGIGIFFSHSRTGIFVFFITISLMFVVHSLVSGKKTMKFSRKRRSGRVIRTVILAVLFSVILIGAKPIIERFSWATVARTTRPVIFENTIDLIKDFPLFGIGPGSYVYAYTMFEKIDVRKILEHAHNDYLELLAESGFIGGGSLILFAFGAVGYLFFRMMKRRNNFVIGISLGCIIGVVAILIHSISDFNLRVPANAVYFVTLYALAIKITDYRRERE